MMHLFMLTLEWAHASATNRLLSYQHMPGAFSLSLALQVGLWSVLAGRPSSIRGLQDSAVH